MLLHLIDLESTFDPEARHSYDPVELVRFGLQASDYWADLAVQWLESGVDARSTAPELVAVVEDRQAPQALRHRAKRLLSAL